MQSLVGLGVRAGVVGVLLVALAACGQSGEVARGGAAEGGRPSTAASPTTQPVSRDAEEKAPAESSASSSPSLPPGDPGLDAPSVPDPGTAPVKPHGKKGESRVRRTVPAAALLSADDVSMTTGATWEQRDGGGDECVRPDEAVATRSRSFGGAGAGVVVETVATYRNAKRADAAVDRLAGAARQCGWGSVQDPRLGSASVRATADGRSLTAVAAEGVVVLLVGNGPVTKGWQWDALVDMALGSSCPAAPDGCH